MLIIVCILAFFSLFPPSYAQLDELENNKNATTSEAMSDRNWTTYKSDVFGISFDYPSGWNIQEKENRFDSGPDVSVSDYDTIFSASKTTDRPEDNPLKSSAISTSTRMLEERIAQGEKDTIIQATDVKKYKVGGERTGTFVTKHEDGVSSPIGMQTFIVFHNGDGYMLNFRAPAESFDNPETQDIMNGIIQSFRFIP